MVTTLVFGAGVSQPYGYPSGQQLVSDIKKKLSGSKEYKDKQFLEALNNLNPYSIDSFLKDMPEFELPGKATIAEILFEAEDESKLSISADKNFYQLLFNKMTLEKYSNFRIISFNYDRSFEFYFARALTTLFKCSLKEAFEKLTALKIEHVHGRLSALDNDEQVFTNKRERSQLEYGFYRKHLMRPQVSLFNESDIYSGGYKDQLKSSMWIYGKEAFKTV